MEEFTILGQFIPLNTYRNYADQLTALLNLNDNDFEYAHYEPISVDGIKCDSRSNNYNSANDICCWHQDRGSFMERQPWMILWTNVSPTEVKLSSGKIVVAEENDVILINNISVYHRMPRHRKSGRHLVRITPRTIIPLKGNTGDLVIGDESKYEYSIEDPGSHVFEWKEELKYREITRQHYIAS